MQGKHNEEDEDQEDDEIQLNEMKYLGRDETF